MLGNVTKSSTITLRQKLVAETFGTFILVFSVSVTQGNPLSVAPALWAAMISTGFISGGQFNPAVSIAVIVNSLLSKAPDFGKTLILSLIFIFIQFGSGLLAAYIGYLVINTNDKNIAFFDVTDTYKVSQAFLAELFFTTVLTGSAVIGGKYTNSNILAGGIVATTVSAGDYSVGEYTGGCFNPAVGFGTNMIYYFVNGGTTHRVWLYIVAPSLGGVLGGSIATFFILNGKSLENLRKVYY